MHRDNEAVSPVIATVLLLAITVLLSSMVFIMMSSTFDSVEKDDPKASFSVRGLSNGYHVVTITSIDQSLDPAKIKWSIVNESSTRLVESNGFTDDADVYGTVGANISFHDRDRSIFDTCIDRNVLPVPKFKKQFLHVTLIKE